MGSFAILRRCISRGRIFRSPSIHSCLRSLNSATNQWGSRIQFVDGDGDGDGKVVGCSHGWVAVFNKRNNNLFLSDPLSHEQIKLPPIETLPDREFNLDLDGQGSVSKLVLSAPPRGGDDDDDECRAMMSFGPANRLAFCLPGRSSEWTPIGDEFFKCDGYIPFASVAKLHEDLVYCSRRKVFTSITAAHFNLRNLELDHTEACFPSEICDWDVEDPDSPKLVRSDELYYHVDVGEAEGRHVRRWLDDNIELLEKECIQIPHLVYAEELDRLFVAVQFVRLMKEDDGCSPLGFVPSCELKGLSGVFRGKTFGFLALEVLDEQDCFGIRCRAMGDLNGMTMFVGINTAFATIAHELSGVKPNCIYFTDSKRLKRVCGVDDTGIFDYATKTISEYHHRPTPSFNLKASSSPFWFI